MAAKKNCFLNRERPCDLTCKAAFEVDDPVDNIDCHFIWLAYHFGESVFAFKSVLENMGGAGGAPPSPPAGGFPSFGGGLGPKKPKNPPPNN